MENEVILEKETVACYCRVSTNSNDQKNSYDAQRRGFETDLGEEYNLRIYADRGITGTRLKRGEFNQMLYDAGLDRKHSDVDEFQINKTRKPLFRRIFVSNTSRFARNVLVVGILRELRNNGVYVYFLDKDIDTEDTNWEFVFNLFMNFDQQESLDKSSKVRQGHFRGAQKGTLVGSGKLYGYRYNVESKSLEIVPEEAEVIRKIFQWYSENYGIRRIINLLDDEKIKTRVGESFSKSTLSKILENEKYSGDLVRNKYETATLFVKNSYVKMKPETEWIPHPDKVPAIISKDLFQKCQELKKGRSKNHRGVYRGKSKYAGLLKCIKCGSSYTRNSDRGKYFYNCSLKKSGGIKACDSPNLYEDFLEKKIDKYKNGALHFVFGMSKDTKVRQLNELKKELLSRIDKEKSDDVEVKLLLLEELNTKKNNLLDLLLEGKWDKEEIEKRRIKIDAEIDSIKDEVKHLSMQNDDIYAEIREIDEQIELINKQAIKESFDDQEIIESISQIDVYRSHTGQVGLAFQFKAIDLVNRITSKYNLQLLNYTDKYFQKKFKVKGMIFS